MSTITMKDGTQIYYKDWGKRVAEWSLRVTIAAGFLSAVADRFGLWGPPGAANVDWGAWQPFVDHTRLLTFYLPQSLAPLAAIFATLAEAVLGVWLLVGWRTRVAAYASAALLLTFALSMTLAVGVKSPLNYATFTAVAAAFALAVLNTSPTRPASPSKPFTVGSEHPIHSRDCLNRLRNNCFPRARFVRHRLQPSPIRPPANLTNERPFREQTGQ